MIVASSRIVRRAVPTAFQFLNVFAFLSAGLGIASQPHANHSSNLSQEDGGSTISGRVWFRQSFAAHRLRWLTTLLFAVFVAGPAWASCPSTVTLSVPAGGSVALACPTDGGINWGFLEVDTSTSYTTTYGHVSLLDPDGDIYAAGYFNTSGAGLTDEFDLTDGSNNQPVHFIINIGPGIPVANPVSATVAYGSGANPITLDITGGTATSVAVGTAASHGTALPSGTSITYQPDPGFAGSDSFTYTASNADGTSAPATVSITVSPPTLSLTPAAGMLALDYNVVYSQTFSASGGAMPYSYTLTGTLPTGLSFDSANGTLSGTPKQSGSFPVTVTATDSSIGTGAPFSVANNYTLQVSVPTITITPATLPAGAAGDAYSRNLAASGGIGPYTFLVTAGALPTGLALASDGTLSGTPTANGTFAFTVQAQDANSQTGTHAYNLTISGATLTLAPSTLPDGAIGAAYSQSFSTTGGIAPYSYAITAGALPTGLSLASDGTLSGTPTAGGTFNFDVRVSDSSGGTPSTATVSYALTVAAPTITLVPATLPAAQLSSAYSATISASGGTAPYSFAVTAGALPASLSLAADGTLSGTPTAFGTFNFTVSATDSSTGSGPYSASRAFTLTVGDTAAVANPVSATVSYGSGANPITLDITGGAATSVAIGTAASHGTALASGTTITYQPAAGFAGSDSFTYTASNTGGTSAPATVSITVSPPTLSLTPAAGTLALDYNATFSQTFSASGGAAPYSYTLTGTLPTGLSFAAASGTLSGTPTQSGSFPVTVTATDSSTGSGAPFSVANNYTLQVSPATITIAPAALPDATVGSGYSQNLAASGGIGPYTFSVSAGALPAGLNLAGDGTLSGTPSANGTFAFTVQAHDANGQIATRLYNLTVSGATLTLVPATLPDGAIGAVYSQSFSTTGGIAPYSYAITAGALPAGLTLSADGSLSGTPTAGGTFNLDVRVTDSSGGTPSTATVSYALTVAAPTITLVPATLPAAQLSSAYSATISASGGTAPYSFAVTAGALPAGLTLVSNGTLSGTPTAFGTFSFTVSATDSSTGGGPYSASRAFTLTMVPPDPSQDPEVIGLLTAQAEAAKRFAETQINNFNRRLEQLHDEGERRRNSININVGTTERASGRTDYAEEERDPTAGAFKRMGRGNRGERPASASDEDGGNPAGNFAVWTGGYVNFAEVDNGSIDLDSTLVGVSGGVDYRFSPKFVAGLGFGYGRDKTDIGGNGTESRGRAWSMAAYGSYKPAPNIFIDGMVGYGFLDFDSRRHVTATGDIATGSRDGRQLFGSLAAGYEYRKDGWLFSPYGRLEASRSTLDGFTESGGGIWGLTYGDQNVDTLSGTLGLRVEYAIPMYWGVLKPRARLEYTHDFEGSSRVRLGYSDIGTMPYEFDIDPLSKDYLTVGLGFDARIVENWNLGFDYRTAFGSGGDHREQEFGVNINVKF